jgi:hypothetical protein
MDNVLILWSKTPCPEAVVDIHHRNPPQELSIAKAR